MMQKLFRKSLITIILVIALIVTGSSLLTEDKKEKNDKYIKEEAEFEIDVHYRVIDVMVMDEDGNHVLGLEKDDFVLKINKKEIPIASLDVYNYIDDSYKRKILSGSNARSSSGGFLESVKDSIVADDGFEQSPSDIGVSLALRKQPPRTFVIVFANLPYLPRRWFNLRDGLLDYIRNSMGDNVQIAVYSMGMRKLGLLMPFTTNKKKIIRVIDKYLSSRWGDDRDNEGNYDDGIKRIYDLDEDPEELLIMADAPDLDIDHTNSSWLISGFDAITITSQTLFDLFKQFDMIINRLREIPGRKNILLFSEGFPWASSRIQDYINVRNRKRSIVSRMNRNNISLYVFDLFTTRDMSSAARRQGFLAEFSADTGGGLFPFLGNNPIRMKKRLVSMDIQSACYYLVGFYTNDLQFDESTMVDLDVNKDGVTLFYNKWMNGKEIYSGPERYLNEMEISRKLFNRENYSELHINSNLQFLPGDEEKTWVNIATRFPVKEMIMPTLPAENRDKPVEVPSVLEANIGIELEQHGTMEKVIALKTIEYSYLGIDESITYNYRVLLDPGLYNMRLFMYSKINKKTAAKTQEISIPDFSFDTNTHSLILTCNDKNETILQNSLNNDDDESRSIKGTPFFYREKEIAAASFPVYKSGDTINFYLYYNIRITTLPTIQLRNEEGVEFSYNLVNLEKPSSFITSFVVTHGVIKLPSLPPGKYNFLSFFDIDGRKNITNFSIK